MTDSAQALGAALAQPAAVDGGAPVPQMGEQQQRAQTEVNRLRAEFKNVPAGERDVALQRMTKLSRFAQGYGEKPSDFEPQAKAPDLRPYEPEREVFETQSQPATTENVERAIALGTVRGLDPGLAKEVAEFSAGAGLPESSLRVVMERAAHHFGAGGFDMSPLEPAEIQEYVNESARRLGGIEKFEAMTDLARRYMATLQTKSGDNFLAVLEKRGITRSTLAFDPCTLQIIANAAARAGFK